MAGSGWLEYPAHGPFWLAGVLLTCLVMGTPAVAQEGAAARRWSAMSAASANRAIRRDLLSILAPRGKIGRSERDAPSRIQLSTLPVGTIYKGVCRRDSIIVHYRPGDGSSAAVQALPMRPYGLTARTLYHIVALPRIDDASGHLEESSPDQPVCESLDYGDADPRIAEEGGGKDAEEKPAIWMSAADPLDVVRAALLIDRAIAGVAAGTLKPLPCGDNRIGPLFHSCEEAVLASGGWRAMTRVEACPSDTGLMCYKVEGEMGLEITIVARDDDRGAPGRILSLGVEQFVTVT